MFYQNDFQMSFAGNYVERRIRKNTFFKINHQLVSHKVIIKNGIGIVDATLTDAPCCPKGKTEYKIAEDRKEDQRKVEDCEKEEVQMKLVKKTTAGSGQ